MEERDEGREELERYLARIRKTIADSESLVSQARLRVAETDRMLESQGLTREQVMNYRFTEDQIEMVNRELARRGMDPLDDAAADAGGMEASEDPRGASVRADPEDGGESELAVRQRKFGMMMKPFQI